MSLLGWLKLMMLEGTFTSLRGFGPCGMHRFPFVDDIVPCQGRHRVMPGKSWCREQG